MSNLTAALSEHNSAVNDRQQARDRMGGAWRDAASRVVEARYLGPLDVDDRSYAAALGDLAHELGQAERLLDS